MLKGFEKICSIPMEWIEPRFRLALKILYNILHDQKCPEPHWITGSVCSRISMAHIAPSGVLLQRDKFKDIDFLTPEGDFIPTSIEINSFKYDKVNFYLKRTNNEMFYDIDSSLYEIIYDLNTSEIFATSNCMRTMNENKIYPPYWFVSNQDPNIHIDMRKEQIGKPFQRSIEKYVDLSDEMIEYMNFLIKWMYDQDKGILEIQSITDFPIEKYQSAIEKYQDKLSDIWKWFFEQCERSHSETEISKSFAMKYNFLRNGKLE